MNKVVLIGDPHSEEFWKYNHDKLRDFKPDYLLLEVIGKHRYLTQVDRDRAFRNLPSYMKNPTNMGYSSDAFKLANDLNVPMIGIDVWNKPYDFPEYWKAKDEETNFEYSHTIRERNMLKVLREFDRKGRILLIVGAEHLRDDSLLRKYANLKKFDVKFFKM